MKKRLALLLATVMVITSMTACGGNKKEPAKDATGGETKTETTSTSTIDTMVIGTQSLDGVFNPLFYSSAYDNQINDLVFTSVCRLDEKGELIDWAGHVDTEEITAEDGHTQVKYTVSINKDMTFSDGEPVTIDDLLFYYYVVSDPTYDGMATFSTLDIVGMKEYYYDTPDYTKIIKEIEDKYAPENISKEDFVAYLVDTKCDGWFGGELPGDVGDGRSWADYLKDEGYDASAITKPEDMLAMLADCEYEKYAANYDVFSYYKKQAVLGTLEDGIDVDTISGIERVDDYTCTVLFDSPNISGDKLTAWQPLMPEHYYGKDWKKGDLSSIKALNGTPIGSGPYIFKSYENNIVSFDANPAYFKGEPKTPHAKIQVVNEEDKVDLVINGDVDITDPSASLEIIAQIDAEENVEKSLVDNPGYGYIGINAEKIPDINVRKGLLYLMNRAPAVSSYYGDLGTVIERPMTPTLAEYPRDAKEYYGYDPAKALECFKKAGYEEKDGKLVKDGKQLVVNACIGDAKTHPSTPIFTQMSNDMEKMGAELIVNDVEFSVLSTKVQGGEVDMWVMAWGNATDCDLTQIFGSKGGSNYQHYYDTKIDNIQAEILKTVDFDARCKLVAEELDMIMDAAVYMPVYQRKNMEIYNAANVNISTLPENTTTYWNYVAQIETLEMN
ncbi:MAG: ABC transporter substrate-binding protein [Acetivibrio sp.]